MTSRWLHKPLPAQQKTPCQWSDVPMYILWKAPWRSFSFINSSHSQASGFVGWGNMAKTSQKPWLFWVFVLSPPKTPQSSWDKYMQWAVSSAPVVASRGCIIVSQQKAQVQKLQHGLLTLKSGKISLIFNPLRGLGQNLLEFCIFGQTSISDTVTAGVTHKEQLQWMDTQHRGTFFDYLITLHFTMLAG